MRFAIIPCTINDVATLQLVAIETFFETYSKQNTAANLNNYIEQAFELPKLEDELRNPHSQFYFASVNEEVVDYLKINILDAQSEPMGTEALEVERIYGDRHIKRTG